MAEVEEDLSSYLLRVAQSWRHGFLWLMFILGESDILWDLVGAGKRCLEYGISNDQGVYNCYNIKI